VKDIQSVHVIISGRVQGVFFRMETQRSARRLGITGWVRNLPDGIVEAVLEGDQRQLEAMLAWCRRGPAHARVDDLHVEKQANAGAFEDFQIYY